MILSLSQGLILGAWEEKLAKCDLCGFLKRAESIWGLKNTPVQKIFDSFKKLTVLYQAFSITFYSHQSVNKEN